LQNSLQKNHRLLFYASWLLLNLVQALFTELQDDEAYYWVYAHFLDWGYFDHPPMTAAIVKLGTALLPGEIGVRLLAVLMNTATIFICEKLTSRKNPNLFYIICLSLIVVQITGFMAVPDTPLMFFTALFFLVYRNYLESASWKNTLLLGLVTACLLYSKYHGVLIVFFVLISNLRLFRDVKVYAAGVLALLLFLPHLWWQYQHDWITFKYHLFESNVNRYKINYTLEYIAGQLLLAGPLAGVILLPAVFLYRTTNLVERALKFMGIGIFAFFFLSSFKGKVEANWTSPAIIAVIVLAHGYLQGRNGGRRWLYRLLWPALVLVLVARTAMIADFIPNRQMVQRYHSWKHWPEQMKQNTKGLPVVFNNSYQRASKYWFYTGQRTYSPNFYRERRNNYNFWPLEDSTLGKPVYILDIYNLHLFPDSLQAPSWKVGYRFDSSYHSFMKIMIVPERSSYAIQGDATLSIPIKTLIPAHYATYLRQHPKVDHKILIGIFQGQTWIKDIDYTTLQGLLAKPSDIVRLTPSLPPGSYFLRFAIGSDSELQTHNSEKIKLEVGSR
jgi:hypothetical protein